MDNQNQTPPTQPEVSAVPVQPTVAQPVAQPAPAPQVSASVESATPAQTVGPQQVQPTPTTEVSAVPIQPTVTQPAAQPAPIATNTQPASSAPGAETLAADHVPFYRRYWWFAVIFLLLPFGLLIGLALLATGTIYKKAKVDGLYHAISAKEKSILIVVAVILQAGAVLRAV